MIKELTTTWRVLIHASYMIPLIKSIIIDEDISI
jgi:hypothetical protein